jgi:hypothetical protein
MPATLPVAARVLALILVLVALVSLLACAVVYVREAPRLQQAGTASPFCLIACSSANSSTAAEGPASSVDGGDVTQEKQRLLPRGKP